MTTTTDLSVASASLPAVAVEPTDAARDAIRASKSINTLRCYKSQFARWSAYASPHGLGIFPADPGHVANWCAERAASGQAMPTIRTGVAALVFLHRQAGHDFDADEPMLVAVLQGLDRQNTRQPKQAAPLGPDLVAAILDRPGDSLADLRDKALIGLAYAFGLRASELVSLDLGQIGAGRGVLIDTGPTLDLHRIRGKAIKSGRGHVAALRCTDAPHISRAIRRWMALGGVQDGQPLALRIRSGDVLTTDRLTTQSVTAILRGRVEATFQDQGRPDAADAAKRYTSHAARVGLITTARHQGVSTDDLAHHVGQHPQTTARYARGVDALAVSPLRKAGVGV